MVVIYIVWCLLCLVASFLMYARLKNKSIPVIFGYITLFVAAPASSLIVFQKFEYTNVIPLIISAHASFLIGVMIYVLFVKDRDYLLQERDVKYNLNIIIFLLISFLLVSFGNFKIYQTIFSLYSVGSLNDLNIAFNDPNIPSFGIYSRLSRLAVPLGIACLSMFVYSKDKGSKRVYFWACLIFTLTLVGVRRATLLNQLVFYIFILLPLIKSRSAFIKYTFFAAVTAALMATIFGYVQINTNKSKFDIPILSGFYDGSTYIAGNLPYAECLASTNLDFSKGNSFPFIYLIVNRVGSIDNEIKKPFCDIGDGLLFNTSPVYYDLYRDFGYVGVMIFMLILGFGLMYSYGNVRFSGIQAMIAGSVFFGIRENLIGQYDTLFALMLYVPLVFLLTRLAKRRSANV